MTYPSPQDSHTTPSADIAAAGPAVTEGQSADSDDTSSATEMADEVGLLTVGMAPKPAKPRLLQDGRDMFWSLAPLVVVCVVLAGMVGMCSVGFTGPKVGDIPPYDVAAALGADADVVGFPVRLPQLPDGWQANSGRRGSIEAGRVDAQTGQRQRAVTSTVGYLTSNMMYVSVIQSNADEAALVESIDPAVYPRGIREIDGVQWIMYEGGVDAEPVWTTRLHSPAGGAQIAITGAADSDDFRILAAAIQSQQPLTP